MASSNGRNRENWLKKMEMPIFEEDDVYGWIARAERFFRIGQYAEDKKMSVDYVSLAGRVLRWYNWEVQRVPFTYWKEFKTKLLKRFGTARSLTPSERLFSLKQEGSIDDYVANFEYLSSQVYNLDDESLEYLSGMKIL